MVKREKHPDRIAMEDYASQRLREIRNSLGLTQDEMAELLAFKIENTVNTKTVYRWEAGIHPVPAWVLLHLEMLNKEIDTVPHEKVSRKLEPFVIKVLNRVREKLNRSI